MASRTITATAEKFIQAAPPQVFHALTHATALREWLCDVATVAPRPNGRIYLWWNGDFYSHGVYKEVVTNEKVVFTWYGRGDPGPSLVTITLKAENDGTLVAFAHRIPTSKAWNGYAEAFQKEWASTLENLASVLESGVDLRIYNRPMLGINIGDSAPAQLARLGTPVNEGIRLDGVVEGMGAFGAGLRKDDVLIEMNGKKLTNDFSSLVVALQGKKGGEVVEVVYYRGAEKRSASMQLSKRPIPVVPWDPAELARQVWTNYERAFTALAVAVEDVPSEMAAKRPAENEWSVKEVLAHIIITERFFMPYFAGAMEGEEMWTDRYADNSFALTAATANAFPDVPAMMLELERLVKEMNAFVTAWPPEYTAYKGTYFRIASQMLQFHQHILEHIPQIEAAITAAR